MSDRDVNKAKPNIEFVVLFDLGNNVQAPFGIYPRTMFKDNEIKEKWLGAVLDHSSRMHPLNLDPMNGKKLSLFGKIQEGYISIAIYIYINKIYMYIYFYLGMSETDRETIIEILNKTFSAKMQNSVGVDSSSILKIMVNNYPFRLTPKITQVLFLHYIIIFKSLCVNFTIFRYFFHH